MYCPRCGQQQVNHNTKFCSRCRFIMTGIDEVVENGGLPKQVLRQQNPDAISPRRRGLKQGGLIFLSGILIVPLLAVLITSLNNGPEELVVVAALLTFLGGILRMVYALFQSGIPTVEHEGLVETIKHDLVGKKVKQSALPPQQSEPIQADFQPAAGNWRETADLHPANNSEKATKTLNNNTFQ